jgi:hypothetical protein
MPSRCIFEYRVLRLGQGARRARESADDDGDRREVTKNSGEDWK